MDAPESETARAMGAAARVLARLGLGGEANTTPRILADRSQLVLAMDPHPVVARVAMATSRSRIGLRWMGREVAVARHLDAAGVPTTRPARSVAPGPHEEAGFFVSFWERETLRDGPHEAANDPSNQGATAGRLLAAAHRALRTFPAGELPYLGAWEETRSAMEQVEARRLLREPERAQLRAAFHQANTTVEGAAARTASFQAVHGDAHLGNVMQTERGALWTDWEDAFLGPVEWDLATLASRYVLFGEESAELAAAMAAYDAPFRADLVRDLGLARNVQVVAWLALFAERDPSLTPRVARRLAKLEEQLR